jgi:RNA polymerase sigma factor (TIGR02999 family)
MIRNNDSLGYLSRERPGQTLRPTDLVSEAYLRLASGSQPNLENRVHFFGIAARTMRQILVDHARKRDAGKRGGGERPGLDDQVAAVERLAELLALDAALEELAAFDARKARIVELLYFGGLTQDEIAQVENLHVNTRCMQGDAGEFARVGRLCARQSRGEPTVYRARLRRRSR